MRRMIAVLAVLVTWLATSTARADTFASGSYIIPMDTTYQDAGMLKAYGLVYKLLTNGVPVRWCIQPGKSLGGVDFTATGKDHKTNAVISSYGYRGGPWVIDSASAAAALPIIDAWQAANASVNVHEATATFSAPVAKHLVVAPRVSMFADGNQGIARGYLQAAGIPDSTGNTAWPNTSPDMLTVAQVSGPTTSNHHDGALFDADGDPVYCQFMSMHWGVNDAVQNPEVVAEVRSFLGHPTHFFAECQAVNAFENLVPYGHFLTPNGYVIKSQPSSVDFHHLDSPFVQIDGAFQTVGGSEPAYALPAGDSYKAGGITMITAHNAAEGTNDLWMTGYLDGVCPPDAENCGGLGKVSYLGGHQYTTNTPISSNPKTQGTRLFLNSLFDSTCASAGGQPVISVFKSAPATTTNATVTFTIGYANLGQTTALAAKLTDTLPPGAAFVSATNGGTFAAGKVTWSLGNLGASESGAVSVTVTLGVYGTYANTAHLDYKVGLNPFGVDSNTTSTQYGQDTDGDGVFDAQDTCPTCPNPAQDLQTDPASCGTCCNVCAAPNGTPGCVGGACVVGACDPGFIDCNGVASDGCEYGGNIFTDPANCGACGAACTYQHAQGLCNFGSCALGACDPGFENCNQLAADGCEYAVGAHQTDPQNCGSCGFQCSAGFDCVGGGCVLSSCPPGTSNCDAIAANGCEYANTGFQTDPFNCGSCGVACALAHASSACVAASCAITTCAPGYADCNALPSDGCEVPTTSFQTDPNACGGCGNVCQLPSATAACAAGACVVATCAAGKSDCDGVAMNGCEVDDVTFQTDPANCGACGAACALPDATAGCVAGACVVASCDPGYVDLDGVTTNGCEYACAASAANDVTCDAIDDDCDGVEDDDYAPTTCGTSVCQAQSTCVLGVDSCSPAAPGIEGPLGDASCADGVDNDCDNSTDGADSGCVPPCTTDAACDDGNPCTADTCAAQGCLHAGIQGCGAGGAGGAGATSSTSTGSGASSSSGGIGGATGATTSSGSGSSTAVSSSGVGAGGGDGTGTVGGGEGCSCGVTTDAESDSPSLLAVGVLALLAVRRRRVGGSRSSASAGVGLRPRQAGAAPHAPAASDGRRAAK